MPPEIVSSVTDRNPEFVFDGSPLWSPDYALRVMDAKGISIHRAERALAEVEAGLQEVPPQWLGDRLTLMWAVFTAGRTAEIDSDAVVAWLGEFIRLLADLPHDIVALAIDRAIQTARHGFIPSVGEIRAHAEPLAVERERIRDRLRLTLEHATKASRDD